MLPPAHVTDGALPAERPRGQQKLSLSSSTAHPSTRVSSHFGSSFALLHTAGGKYLQRHFENNTYPVADSVLMEHSMENWSCMGMSGRPIFFTLWHSRNAALKCLSSQLLLHFLHLYKIQCFMSDTGAAFKRVAHLAHKILHVLNPSELCSEYMVASCSGAAALHSPNSFWHYQVFRHYH